MTSTSAISTIAPSATATQSLYAAQQAVQPTTQDTTSTPSTVSQAGPQSISPRIIDDPTAGLITQYLDSNGKVESQYPSTTVVAYLRAGLTAQGLSRHSSDQVSSSSQTA